MPVVSGSINGAIGPNDEVVVELLDLSGHSPVVVDSVILMGSNTFELNGENRRYALSASTDSDSWAFEMSPIPVDLTQGDATGTTFHTRPLVDYAAIMDDETDRKFVKAILTACLHNADEWMDAKGVQGGREFIRNLVFEALKKQDNAANEVIGQQPEQQQQFRALPDIGESGPLDLADEPVARVEEWLRLPNGERAVRPLYAVACSVCWKRFNTPGTPYYQNQAALNACLATCT